MLDGAVAVLAAAGPATTPILLAAMGGLINRQGGIVNIGLEGKMVAGALAAVLVSASTGSPLLGVVAAGLSGGVIGLVFSWTITRLGANQIIAGLGLNLAIVGLIGYLLPVLFGVQGMLVPAGLKGLPHLKIPILDGFPVLGPIFSDKDYLTYFSWISVPLVSLFLYRTTWGLRLRATGANQEAARAAGIASLRWTDISTVIAGVFSGLAGAQLALGLVTLFNKNMTAGRGFIALAAFYFGDARPGMTALAAFIFGLVESMSFRLQSSGLPPQIVQMLPYLVVVASLTVTAVRRQLPARKTKAMRAGPGAAQARWLP